MALSPISLSDVPAVFSYIKSIISTFKKPDDLSDLNNFEHLNEMIENYEFKYKDNIPFFKLLKKRQRYMEYKKIIDGIGKLKDCFPLLIHEEFNRLVNTIKNEFEKVTRLPQYRGDSLNKLKYMPKDYLIEIWETIKAVSENRNIFPGLDRLIIQSDETNIWMQANDVNCIRINIKLLNMGEINVSMNFYNKYINTIDSSLLFQKIKESKQKNADYVTKPNFSNEVNELKKYIFYLSEKSVESEFHEIMDDIYNRFLRILDA